jgi:D-arabinitol dehydrogenase (NADP+)
MSGSRMRAVVYDRPGSFVIADVPRPAAGPGDVLLRVVAAGVCGTDLHLHAGEFGPSYPLTPGHEIVGVIEELGEAVEGVSLGDRVVLDNTTACGRCEQCRRARPAFCRNLLAQGVNRPGGFADFVTADAGKCFVVNDLRPETAVFAEPLACVVHGLDVLRPMAGARILLFGAGPTGLLLTGLLARTGAYDLTVAAPSEHKLSLASSLGASRTLLVARQDPSQAVLNAESGTLGGFDVVIDATGSLAVLARVLDFARIGGTVFVYGMAAEDARWDISPYDVFRRELTIKGSFAQQYSFDRAVQALRSHLIPTEGLITHTFPLERYADALAAVRDSQSVKVVIAP